jgi:hypothetical protein
MIHKRFNHTRHLIWATFLLTVFAGPAVTNRHLAPAAGIFAIEKSAPHKPVADDSILITYAAIK